MIHYWSSYWAHHDSCSIRSYSTWSFLLSLLSMLWSSSSCKTAFAHNCFCLRYQHQALAPAASAYLGSTSLDRVCWSCCSHQWRCFALFRLYRSQWFVDLCSSIHHRLEELIQTCRSLAILSFLTGHWSVKSHESFRFEEAIRTLWMSAGHCLVASAKMTNSRSW